MAGPTVLSPMRTNQRVTRQPTTSVEEPQVVAPWETDPRTAAPWATWPPELSLWDVVLEPAEHALICHGRRTVVRPREFRLLHALVEAQGAWVPRRTLIDRLWRTDERGGRNTLNTHASNLRRTLALAGSELTVVSGRELGLTLRIRPDRAAIQHAAEALPVDHDLTM